jgi:hypothetical protein
MRKQKGVAKMVSPKEYAELKGAKYQTVMLWLRQGLIPGAEKIKTPAGHYYAIPDDAPKPQPKRGARPKKATKKGGK